MDSTPTPRLSARLGACDTSPAGNGTLCGNKHTNDFLKMFKCLIKCERSSFYSELSFGWASGFVHIAFSNAY